jgi:hypothetical protein
MGTTSLSQHETSPVGYEKNHLPLASAITLVAGLALLVGLGRIHGEQEIAAASPATALGPVHVLKITVLSTMLTDAVGVGEWGFSALVEVDGKRVLFDTGGRPETVLNNARNSAWICPTSKTSFSHTTTGITSPAW